MITLKDYCMGRDVKDPLTEEQKLNAEELVSRLNELEEEYGQALILTSGYRPRSINQYIPNAVAGDAHERCMGVDLHDPADRLSDFCLGNLDILEEIGLWMESPQSSKNHVHLQSFPPKSGKRVFLA